LGDRDWLLGCTSPPYGGECAVSACLCIHFEVCCGLKGRVFDTN